MSWDTVRELSTVPNVDRYNDELLATPPFFLGKREGYFLTLAASLRNPLPGWWRVGRWVSGRGWVGRGWVGGGRGGVSKW